MDIVATINSVTGISNHTPVNPAALDIMKAIARDKSKALNMVMVWAGMIFSEAAKCRYYYIEA